MDNPQQQTHSSGHYGVHFRETPVAVHRPTVQLKYTCTYSSGSPPSISPTDTVHETVYSQTNRVGLSVIHRGQSDSGESCIALQSRPTRSHVAKFPQRSVVTCSTRISCCRGRTLQTRPRTGMCKPLMPDVVLLSGPTYLRIHYTRI